MVVLLALLWWLFDISLGIWSTASWSELPWCASSMAIGHDANSNTIWYMGGSLNHRQLASFNVSKWNEADAWTDHGSTDGLFDAIQGSGTDWYTQKDVYLYMVHNDGVKLSRFDLTNQLFTVTWKLLPNAQSYACIAHVDDYLILSGGMVDGDEVDFLQIYNALTDSWLPTGLPTMITKRKAHTCIVDPINKYLYQIGGYGNNNLLDKVEMLFVDDMTNINDQSFTQLQDTLSSAKQAMRSVIYHTDIYIIGGDPTAGLYIDIIDTATNTITSPHVLAVNLHSTAAIMVYPRIYAMGGYTNTTVKSWQYYEFPTEAPTNAPSAAPSKSPSDAPSVVFKNRRHLLTTEAPTEATTDPTPAPTENPTPAPTTLPTPAPTYYPTIYPTVDPTVDPSVDPTFDPSVDPTHYPTVDPTFDPSVDPTVDPSVDPTVDPSVDPTPYPTVDPTFDPTFDPLVDPSVDPTVDPSVDPTPYPTVDPTFDPSVDPTVDPTVDPSVDPTPYPTVDPTVDPTVYPTIHPTSDPATDSPTPAPTSNPTPAPTDNPTPSPTLNPSFAPTINPSQPPSNTPSYSPTQSPSISPSFSPSTSPTYYPSNAPSSVPTLSPTYYPSASPTDNPTSSPTYNPSAEPTTPSPTEPKELICGDQISGAYNDEALSFEVQFLSDYGTITFDASNSDFIIKQIIVYQILQSDERIDNKLGNVYELHVSSQGLYKFMITTDEGVFGTFNVAISCNENAPTTNPTNSDFIDVTVFDTGTMEDFSSLEMREREFSPELNGLKSFYQSSVITFASLCILLVLLALIDAKVYRVNDYFKFTSILSMFIQTNDTISDCFFVAQIHAQNKIDEKIEYDVIFVLSIVFIVMPAMTALFQLYFHAKKHWLDQNHVRSWLSKFTTLLLLLSVVTGSSFAAVPLLNSYLFQLNMFDMGLTERQLKGFGTKRVYSIVLLENLPQLCLQSYYILSSEADAITISSIIFSSISIIVALLTMTLEKTINYTQSYAIVTMDVVGDCVRQKSAKCRTMCTELRQGFALIIGVNENTMEIVKPTYIKNGFALKLYLYSNDKYSKEVDYKKILVEANQNDDLGTMIKEAWQLADEPAISGIDATIVESKQQKFKTKDIEMLEATVASKSAQSVEKKLSIDVKQSTERVESTGE